MGGKGLPNAEGRCPCHYSRTCENRESDLEEEEGKLGPSAAGHSNAFSAAGAWGRQLWYASFLGTGGRIEFLSHCPVVLKGLILVVLLSAL